MLTIVVPAWNEEAAVAATVAAALGVGAQIGAAVEVLVVDDGSTDATAARAEGAGARVIRHPCNLGYGAALKTGIRAATYDEIAMTDCDGTYPLSALPALLAARASGFDLAIGARQGRHLDSSAYKQVMRTLLKQIVQFTTGQRIPDVNSGLRVFSRRDVTPLLPHLSNAFSFTTSQTLAYLMTGRFVVWLPIDYAARLGKTKVRIVRDSLRTLQYITEALLVYNPLKLFLMVAIALAGVGVVGALALACTGHWLTWLAIWLATASGVFALGLAAYAIRGRARGPGGE